MMKGLELSEKYYHEYGIKMIEEKFPKLLERAAAGLVGQGSECLGFDDEISADHDYGPSFIIWLTRDDYEKYGMQLHEEYCKLPSDFEGVKGRITTVHGQGRVGVISIPDFYRGLIGYEKEPPHNKDWMWIPESRLSMAVNGRVFHDPLGEFTRIRRILGGFYPEDVRIKKIAARAAIMAQSGQYNYARAMKRSEFVAAQLALSEFVKHTISMVYLLNKKYTPFYKWMHHGMTALSVLPEMGNLLEKLLLIGNQDGAWRNVSMQEYQYTLNTADERVVLIEQICKLVLTELHQQGLAEGEDPFLENHTMQLMEKIQDPYIRSLQIMEG